MKFNEARKILVHKIAVDLALKSLKDEVKQMAISHFKKSFDIEGFNDSPVKKWKPLKRKRSQPYTNNKILTKTGKLKNSLRGRSYVGSRVWWVDIYSNVEYANVHNEGLRSGRGRGFKMPKRKFMGNSRILDKKIQTRIDNRIKNAIK